MLLFVDLIALAISLASFVDAKPVPSSTPVQLPLPILPKDDPQPISDIIPVVQYFNATAMVIGDGFPAPPADVLAAAALAPLAKRQTGLYQYSNSKDWPFQSVGRMATSSGVVCSGALVSHKIVLTARHCATPDGSFSFAPGYDSGYTPLGVGNVVYKAIPLQSSSCQLVPQDFAFLVLDKDFGPNYFDIVVPQSSYFNKGIFIQMGYPGGDRSYRQDGLSISGQDQVCSSTNGREEAELTANAVSNPGSSGSPLWAYPNAIWGVVSSAIITAYGGYPTLYASGNEMKVTLDNLRAYFG